MKSLYAFFASLLVLLPNLAQAQVGASAKTADTKPATTAPIGFSRENSAETCTTAPRSEWLPEDEMRLLAEHRGYRIKTFKVTKSNCYEVYGFDRNNHVVEVYFNPVTSRLMRQNVAR